ncbi:hypothetical protein J6590_051818 [Homalodisca vitripennis]|nr:hypothetical protein J6590_051818 [Homalodisca vitripennis]
MAFFNEDSTLQEETMIHIISECKALRAKRIRGAHLSHFVKGEISISKATVDKPLAKKPAQKQISEQPHAGGTSLQWWGVGQASPRTYPGSLRFGVRFAKWQWSGHGREQAGDCRAVMVILGEAAEGYLPHPA